MSFLKKIFIILAVIGGTMPSFVFAQEDPTFGLKGASQGTKLISVGKPVTENTVPELIGSIVGVALSFVGAIFFLLILYAGFLWMTAFGSSEKVDKAKSILEHAAVGLVIVLAAYAISRFVFSALTTATSGSSPTIPAPGTLCAQAVDENACTDIFDNGEPACTWVDTLGCTPT